MNTIKIPNAETATALITLPKYIASGHVGLGSQSGSMMAATIIQTPNMMAHLRVFFLSTNEYYLKRLCRFKTIKLANRSLLRSEKLAFLYRIVVYTYSPSPSRRPFFPAGMKKVSPCLKGMPAKLPFPWVKVTEAKQSSGAEISFLSTG